MKKKTIWDMGRATIGQFRQADKAPLALVVDNVRSLNNIGSMFRTADGFAASAVVLCGISACPPSPEIHKTALGAEESMSWQYFASTADAIAALREQGWTIVCLEQVVGSLSLTDFVPEAGKRYAIVVGNEVDGVDSAVVDSADIWLEIAQSGTKHSLNVAVSAALAMWPVYRTWLSNPSMQ